MSSVEVSGEEIAGMIDHTCLKADATEADIIQLCTEAAKYKFKSVCVNPLYVGLAGKQLRNTGVMPITVVGFPLGASSCESKVFEAGQAIGWGAKEIDMVISIGSLKSGNYAYAEKEIAAIAKECGNVPLKVILETALLNKEEKVLACKISENAGAAFVKTSTGFSTAGATVADVELMRATVGDRLGVKASGGIRSRADALNMIQAGANRLGASASVSIVTAGLSQDEEESGGY